MKKIAHRGNVSGPSQYENQPRYIERALELGYDAEIDVWLISEQLWLGHDKPQYEIDLSFLSQHKERLWIHCKNIEALDYFVDLQDSYQYFWHEEDKYTLTSNNLIWTYPGIDANKNCIVVIFDKEIPKEYSQVFGVCGDYVDLW